MVTPPKYPHLYLEAINGLSEVRGVVGAKTFSAPYEAWWIALSGEKRRNFATLAEAERLFMRARHLTIKRRFTPALTSRREGGAVSGWAHWDALPMSTLIHCRAIINGVEVNHATPSLAAAWDFLARDGHTIKEERLNGQAKHAPVSFKASDVSVAE